MRRYFLILFLSITMIGTYFSNIASATEFDANFSVSAVIPENQVNRNSSYFDITMNPGDEQILEVTLRNGTDRVVKVSQSVNTATTNSNGVVEYGQRDIEQDNTLIHSFADIATAEEEIILEPGTSKTVPIKIQLPDAPFEGILLGGLFYQEKHDEASEDNNEQPVHIQNDFAYIIGVQISVGDVSNIQPELQLNDIQPTQRNLRNVVTANIQNIQPVGIRDLSVDARIYKEGNNDVLREEQRENMRMAPNSNFDFPISWENQPFEDGTYILEMTAEADGETWSWRETFVIGNSGDLNEGSIISQGGIDFIKIGLFVLIGGIIIASIIWMIKRRKRKEEFVKNAQEEIQKED